MHVTLSAGPAESTAVFRLGIDFIPLKPYHEPQFRGIVVQKVIQQLDHLGVGSCSGAALFSARPGDILCVTVLITTPDDLGDVTIIDLIPGGLEPLDSRNEVHDVSSNNFWWPHETRQVHKDSVVWHVKGIYAGAHSFSYMCIANVPGVYALSAARSFQTKHTEVMGTSGAGLFTVLGFGLKEEELLQMYRPNAGESHTHWFLSKGEQPHPKPCPSRCPLGGSCNLARGVCECASRFGDIKTCSEVVRMLGVARKPTEEEYAIFQSDSKKSSTEAKDVSGPRMLSGITWLLAAGMLGGIGLAVWYQRHRSVRQADAESLVELPLFRRSPE